MGASVLVLVCVLVLGPKGNDMALDHEKLDVYEVSIEFARWTGDLLGSLREEVEHEHAPEHGATRR